MSPVLQGCRVEIMMVESETRLFPVALRHSTMTLGSASVILPPHVSYLLWGGLM